jgi:hypothetical protein
MSEYLERTIGEDQGWHILENNEGSKDKKAM